MRSNGQLSTVTAIALLILQIGTTQLEAGEQKKSRFPIDATGTTKVKNENVILVISITNRSKQKITIHVDWMPWKPVRGTLHLIGATTGKELKRIRTIDDPGPDFVTIEPGKSISAETSLTTIFPNINADREGESIDVFWAFEVYDHESKTISSRVGGWTSIPKKR